MSLRLRLTLWYSGILSLTFLLFGIALYLYLSVSMNQDAKAVLSYYANEVYKRINFGLSVSWEGIDLDIKLNDRDTFWSQGIYLQAVNLTTMEASRSSNLVEQDMEIPLYVSTVKKIQTEPSFFEHVTIRNSPFLVYNKAITLPNGTVVGILQAALYAGTIQTFLNTLKFFLILAALLTILPAASIGWFLARKALKPIDQVIEAADRIEKSEDLNRRIPYNGPNDEVGRLVKTINGMLSRIETMYNELNEAHRMQRRFVSDASHELRTPLTTIRGNIDLLKKMWEQTMQRNLTEFNKEDLETSMESLKDIAEEAGRMSRLVQDLLELARADAGFQMEKEPLQLAPLVDEVIRKAQFLPRKVQWRTGDLSPLNGVWVYGNKDYLRQMLFIFIENAFKYTEEGFVQLDALKSDDQVGIRIQDTGIGMDKGDVPKIFERFYRADPSRGLTSGTGLGLSIARWIIDEHGGSVEVLTRKNEGTIFIIWLPTFQGRKKEI